MRKIIFILVILFGTARYSAGQEKQILLGSRISYGISTFMAKKGMYDFTTHPNYDFALSLTEYKPQSIGFNFDIGYTEKGTESNPETWDVSLDYLFVNLLANKFFSKTNTLIGLGGYGAILMQKNVSSIYPNLNSYLSNNMNFADAGFALKVNQRLYERNKTIIGLEMNSNCGIINLGNEDIPYNLKDFIHAKNFSVNLGITIQFIRSSRYPPAGGCGKITQ